MKKLERDFDEIGQLLVSTYDHWEIWWLYKHERPRYVEVMNDYLGFFTSSLSAHFIAMLMNISCLVDSKNMSLKSLINKIKKDGRLNDKTIQEIETRYAKNEKIICSMMILRNNVFAHISEKIDYNEAFEKAHLKYDDFKNLIIELGSIYNLIRVKCGELALGFWVNSSKPDTERMLQDLIEYKKNHGQLS